MAQPQTEAIERIETYASPVRRRSVLRRLDESALFPTVLLLPILIFFLIWNIIPLLWLVGLSFYRYELLTGEPVKWIGLANFQDLISNTTIWSGLGRTLTYMVAAVGIETILGVLLGLLFWGSTRMPGRRLALTLLFTPMVLPPVSVGTYFRLIYDPTFGIANWMIKGIIGHPIDFLGSPSYAFAASVAVDVWMWTPFMILMTLAALGSVPKAELEAAEVDRLPWLKRLRYIVLPHGKFILMLGILLRTIDAFKTTDLLYVMTRGGPGSTTELIGLTLYRKAFEGFSMGWSSALALIALLIAIAFTSVYLYVLNYKESRAQFT